MSPSFRKFVAVLMALWLPLFSGSALAASTSMQAGGQGKCHEAAMAHDEMGMHHIGVHHQHHGKAPAAANEHSLSCKTCGVCHLACTGYLAMPGIELVTVQTAAREDTPFLVAFHSFTSVPLVPPPLARA